MSNHSVTVKAVLTFELVEGTSVRPEAGELMTEGDILGDALAAQIGEQNGAKPPLHLTFYDRETGEESAIYRCTLVEEA